jgi:hypothetical protein
MSVTACNKTQDASKLRTTSGDGTLRNRDAGLIIHHAEAAAYFEQIFLHDWRWLATPAKN